MAQYTSYDDILYLLKSRNAVWSFDDDASNKAVILNAIIDVIHLDTTIDKSCTIPIINGLAELPMDLYRLEHVSKDYIQEGSMLKFQQANGEVNIVYKGIVLENGMPSVPEQAVDYVIAKVEFYKARNEWLSKNINGGQFQYYESELIRTRRKAMAARITKKQAHEMMFMQRWGGMYKSYL